VEKFLILISRLDVSSPKKNAKEVSLKPTEGDLVKYAKFFSVEESMKLIKMARKIPEWKIIKNILN
jgi:hypothetical protein